MQNSIYFVITYYLSDEDKEPSSYIYTISTPKNWIDPPSHELNEQRTRIEHDEIAPRIELRIRNIDD